MELVICSKTHELEIFNYIKQKRPNFGTSQFQKIHIVVDDREGTVEVIDNREGKGEYHKFTYAEFQSYFETLTMDAAKSLFPEGESK